MRCAQQKTKHVAGVFTVAVYCMMPPFAAMLHAAAFRFLLWFVALLSAVAPATDVIAVTIAVVLCAGSFLLAATSTRY